MRPATLPRVVAWLTGTSATFESRCRQPTVVVVWPEDEAA